VFNQLAFNTGLKVARSGGAGEVHSFEKLDILVELISVHEDHRGFGCTCSTDK